MSRPGVSFHQLPPGISDAILPRDHAILYFLNFHARQRNDRGADFTFIVHGAEFYPCHSGSGDGGPEQQPLRPIVVGRHQAQGQAELGRMPCMKIEKKIVYAMIAR